MCSPPGCLTFALFFCLLRQKISGTWESLEGLFVIKWKTSHTSGPACQTTVHLSLWWCEITPCSFSTHNIRLLGTSYITSAKFYYSSPEIIPPFSISWPPFPFFGCMNWLKKEWKGTFSRSLIPLRRELKSPNLITLWTHFRLSHWWHLDGIMWHPEMFRPVCQATQAECVRGNTSFLTFKVYCVC